MPHVLTHIQLSCDQCRTQDEIIRSPARGSRALQKMFTADNKETSGKFALYTRQPSALNRETIAGAREL